ncbi:MAG: NAD(P)-binding domain-containing protein, partial [Thermoanaerobaculia bacterium]
MRIAWIGTGLMGRPMAERLLAAGHQVTVYNRTRETA